jgi:hypothetical protein
MTTNGKKAVRNFSKMDIFITWSGPRSLAVAEALRDYLPVIVNAFKPWLSKSSLEKGVNWSTELTAALGKVSAGIICLTPSNLTEPWILFEAGAIAKAVTEKPRACTLLIGLKSSDVKGPLTQFQDTKLTRGELLQLVQNLNAALGEAALKEIQVERTFDLVWPKLEERLDLSRLPSDGPTDKPERTPDDLLTEILDTVRSTSQENFRLLKFAIDRIVSVSEKIPSRGYLTTFTGLGGIDYQPRVEEMKWVKAGSDTDASTTGNETPDMSEVLPSFTTHGRKRRGPFEKDGKK